MSLSIANSLAAQTLPLEHNASSLILYNGHAGLGASEVNDEVLIAFERGQQRSPFVVAPLWNSTGEPPEDKAAAEPRHPDLQTRWPSLLGSMGNCMIPTPATQAHVTTPRSDRDSCIKGFEEKLNSVGDDAQLANVDLQNCLQKQQQTLQMMSNISKMLYDTAMAVIRKIGG
ncbi:MAG: hypothetical protein ACHP83_08905 [Burkholderiales bacterium]